VAGFAFIEDTLAGLHVAIGEGGAGRECRDREKADKYNSTKLHFTYPIFEYSDIRTHHAGRRESGASPD